MTPKLLAVQVVVLIAIVVLVVLTVAAYLSEHVVNIIRSCSIDCNSINSSD
jgi:hypothetical protein